MDSPVVTITELHNAIFSINSKLSSGSDWIGGPYSMYIQNFIRNSLKIIQYVHKSKILPKRVEDSLSNGP